MRRPRSTAGKVGTPVWRAKSDKSFELKAERKQLKRLIKAQQEKISALQNAGLIDVQRAKFALLKQEFEKAKG